MPHSKFGTGGALTLAAIFCAAQGLTGALPGAGTLAPSGAAIPIITLPDGRSAWRFAVDNTSRLISSATSKTGFYNGAGFYRFIWNGYKAGQNTCAIGIIGNLFYLNIVNGNPQATAINGQNVTVQPGSLTLIPGSEYCIQYVADTINTDAGAFGTVTLFGNGISLTTSALNGTWTLNSTMATTTTLGDATGRGAFDLIETGVHFGTQTTAPITSGQVSSLAGGGYFLDILRPTHPATAPMTYTSQIVGGRLTDVHTVGLRRTSNPISDAGSIVATGTRTGPGAISVADPATNTNGRKFYRLEVSSTGGVTMTTTNYGSGVPGSYVLGCVPVVTAPSSVAFSTVAGCPKIGVITDSRGTPQSNYNIPYRIMRGGTLDNCVAVVAPGAGWQHYSDTVYSGTLYKANGTTQVLTNTDLMTAYLAEAAAEGVTVTCVGPLDVNNWAEAGTDTTYRSRVQGVINRLRAANHKVVILRDIGNEFAAQSQTNLIDHEAYIATLADGVNVVYSDDTFQKWYAAYLDMVSLDGTHLSGTGALNSGGAAIGGLTAAQITANYSFAAVQTAILPGVLLSINNAVGSFEPGQTLVRTLTVRPTNGYLGAVSLAATGLPTGVTATFSPASPLTLTSSSAVNVTMTLTAASDAPLTGSAATVTTTATGGTSAPTVSLALSVIDVTAPQIVSVVVDTNGTSVTITTDSPVTGNAGLSLFENGSFRVLGSLTNLDGYHLTGTLSTAISSGSSVVTWQYNPATGNLVDVGGNEVPASSGTADNNTGGGGSGGGGTLTRYIFSPLRSGRVEPVRITRGATSPDLQDSLIDGTGNPIDLTGRTITASLMRLGGTYIFENRAAALGAWPAGGQVLCEWQAGDLATPGRYSVLWSAASSPTDILRWSTEVVVE